MHPPAVLGALQAHGLYAPYAAQVAGSKPAVGQRPRQGQPLLTLQSPELSARLALARAREQQLQWQLTQQPFDTRLMEAGPALRTHREAAREEVDGLQREVQRLSLAMPFDGSVVETAQDLQPGTWVAPGEKLMQVVGPHSAKVEAFVDEATLQRLGADSAGAFVPDTPERASVSCNAAAAIVAAVQLSQITHGTVASVYGCGISAQQRADGRLVPLQPIFRVRLESCGLTAPPNADVVGMAVPHGTRHTALPGDGRPAPAGGAAAA